MLLIAAKITAMCFSISRIAVGFFFIVFSFLSCVYKNPALTADGHHNFCDFRPRGAGAKA